MSYLSDLTPDELEMLGHALRMVPGNACLTGESAARLKGEGLAIFSEIAAFKSLWNKTAEAIRERDDMAERRVAA
jgi:hypothetical protein